MHHGGADAEDKIKHIFLTAGSLESQLSLLLAAMAVLCGIWWQEVLSL